MILLVGGICIDFLYWLAGRAYSDNSVRDILGNNAACADNDIATDSNAGHNANVAAYPHIGFAYSRPLLRVFASRGWPAV